MWRRRFRAAAEGDVSRPRLPSPSLRQEAQRLASGPQGASRGWVAVDEEEHAVRAEYEAAYERALSRVGLTRETVALRGVLMGLGLLRPGFDGPDRSRFDRSAWEVPPAPFAVPEPRRLGAVRRVALGSELRPPCEEVASVVLMDGAVLVDASGWISSLQDDLGTVYSFQEGSGSVYYAPGVPEGASRLWLRIGERDFELRLTDSNATTDEDTWVERRVAWAYLLARRVSGLSVESSSAGLLASELDVLGRLHLVGQERLAIWHARLDRLSVNPRRQAWARRAAGLAYDHADALGDDLLAATEGDAQPRAVELRAALLIYEQCGCLNPEKIEKLLRPLRRYWDGERSLSGPRRKRTSRTPQRLKGPATRIGGYRVTVLETTRDGLRLHWLYDPLWARPQDQASLAGLLGVASWNGPPALNHQRRPRHALPTSAIKLVKHRWS